MLRKSGFTLIELLVVIAIIAILAAILFPVFARAREKARGNTCLSNIKQLTLGFLMYANDYDERFPGCLSGWYNLPTWRSAIYPYTKNLQIFQCPSRPNAGIPSWPAIEYPPGTTTAGFPASYGANADTGYEGTAPCGLSGGVYQAQIAKPAETLILIETNNSHFPYIGQGAGQACNNIAAVHSGVGNYGFCDGHAKGMKPTGTTMAQNMWSIEDDNPTTNNYGLLIPTMQAAELCAANK